MKPIAIAPLFFVTLLAFTSCENLKPQRGAAKQTVSLTAEEMDIYEAAFRHIFTRNVSAAKQSAAAYFISIQGEDPTDLFLSRFSNNHPPVKRETRARTGRSNSVRDDVSGRKALSFSFEKIRYITRDIVEVDGGYFEAVLSASSQTLRLRRTEKGWVVIKDTLHALS